MAARKTVKATVPRKPKAAAVKKTEDKSPKKVPIAEARAQRLVRQDMRQEHQQTDRSELELRSGAYEDSGDSPSAAVRDTTVVNRVDKAVAGAESNKMDQRTVSGVDERVTSQRDQQQSGLSYDGVKPQHSDESDAHYDEEKITAFRVFVSKLAYEATREDLEEYFSQSALQFGNITDIHIPRQPGNPALNKGYGFVSFDDEADLIRVLEMSSHVILGRDVMLDRATGPKYHSSSKVSEEVNPRYREPYPRYKRQYDENDLRLDRYYRREREDHYRYYYYGSDRGSYASPASYSRSYSGFDPHKPVSYVFSGSSRSDHYGDAEYDNRYSNRITKPPHTRPRTVPKLFIGRMDPETTVGTMRSYFSQFGEIADAYIPRDSYTQKSKGFGFLTFVHKDALHAVMQPNSKHFIDGREVIVDYADMATRRG
ncbi:nucleic acid binding protein, putative [Babesia caballi]|uniref:Nucleic acid binding protein, putative n=1 Tax=Babesia caballi TaxID=5871 RepID=A0AAV4LY73_BABCB|nr:nucleic acid binding protein, putative [Babesia caballi]